MKGDTQIVKKRQGKETFDLLSPGWSLGADTVRTVGTEEQEEEKVRGATGGHRDWSLSLHEAERRCILGRGVKCQSEPGLVVPWTKKQTMRSNPPAFNG